MPSTSEIYYYERTSEGYEICFGGSNIVFARSFQEMVSYVENPENSEFVEVNENNWKELYDAGVFHEA